MHNKIINSLYPLTAARDACLSRLRYARVTASAEYGINVSRDHRNERTNERLNRNCARNIIACARARVRFLRGR